MKNMYVYILANEKNGTLYIGVTNNLVRRVYEHKHKLIEGFSSKYDLSLLVYYEVFDSEENAIKREKRLKGYNRNWKKDLIENMNPDWRDLYEEVYR